MKQKGDARWQRGIFSQRRDPMTCIWLQWGGTLRVCQDPSRCSFLTGVNIWTNLDKF